MGYFLGAYLQEVVRYLYIGKHASVWPRRDAFNLRCTDGNAVDCYVLSLPAAFNPIE